MQYQQLNLGLMDHLRMPLRELPGVGRLATVAGIGDVRLMTPPPNMLPSDFEREMRSGQFTYGVSGQMGFGVREFMGEVAASGVGMAAGMFGGSVVGGMVGSIFGPGGAVIGSKVGAFASMFLPNPADALIQQSGRRQAFRRMMTEAMGGPMAGALNATQSDLNGIVDSLERSRLAGFDPQLLPEAAAITLQSGMLAGGGSPSFARGRILETGQNLMLARAMFGYSTAEEAMPGVAQLSRVGLGRGGAREMMAEALATSRLLGGIGRQGAMELGLELSGMGSSMGLDPAAGITALRNVSAAMSGIGGNLQMDILRNGGMAQTAAGVTQMSMQMTQSPFFRMLRAASFQGGEFDQRMLADMASGIRSGRMSMFDVMPRAMAASATPNDALSLRVNQRLRRMTSEDIINASDLMVGQARQTAELFGIDNPMNVFASRLMDMFPNASPEEINALTRMSFTEGGEKGDGKLRQARADLARQISASADSLPNMFRSYFDFFKSWATDLLEWMTGAKPTDAFNKREKIIQSEVLGFDKAVVDAAGGMQGIVKKISQARGDKALADLPGTVVREEARRILKDASDELREKGALLEEEDSGDVFGGMSGKSRRRTRVKRIARQPMIIDAEIASEEDRRQPGGSSVEEAQSASTSRPAASGIEQRDSNQETILRDIQGAQRRSERR
jgi:hypothetical protein